MSQSAHFSGARSALGSSAPGTRTSGNPDTRRRWTGVRRLETMVLVLVGLLLAVATVNDVVRQTHVNHRLIADLRTWRTLTRHDYRNLSVEQDLDNRSTRDVVCGNTTPGPPKGRLQICLVMTGAVAHGQRAVRGGYYLFPNVLDLRRFRYACFGSARAARLCGLARAPSGAAVPHAPLLGSG
jgi:hypothetical protein